MKYIATVKDREYTIEIDPDRGILIDDVPQEIDFQRLGQSGFLSLLMNHRSVSAVVEEKNDHWDVLIQGELYNVQVQDERVYRLERMRSTGASVDGQAIARSKDEAQARPSRGYCSNMPSLCGHSPNGMTSNLALSR